jgi:hypothetical protein
VQIYAADHLKIMRKERKIVFREKPPEFQVPNSTLFTLQRFYHSAKAAFGTLIP